MFLLPRRLAYTHQILEFDQLVFTQLSVIFEARPLLHLLAKQPRRNKGLKLKHITYTNT